MRSGSPTILFDRSRNGVEEDMSGGIAVVMARMPSCRRCPAGISNRDQVRALCAASSETRSAVSSPVIADVFVSPPDIQRSRRVSLAHIELRRMKEFSA
jgi:hypothetical protein